jgi:hypothetical protein
MDGKYYKVLTTLIIMTLRLSLRDLETALSAPIEYSFKFAYKINSAAREVHRDVWEERPDNEYVQNTVLPLMRNASRLVREVYPTDKEGIFEVMSRRIDNLQRYIKGMPSDCIPGTFSLSEDDAIKIT